MQRFFGFDGTIGVGRNFGFNAGSVEVQQPLKKPVILGVYEDFDMGGVRLEFAQFGDFDSFEVYRSESPMDVTNMPSALAVALITMHYLDLAVVEGIVYYYRVAVVRDGVRQISDEVSVLASGDPYFTNVDLLIIADNEQNSYKDWSLNARNITKQYQVSIQQLEGKPAFRFMGDAGGADNSINGRLITSIAPLGVADYTIEFYGAQTAQTFGGARFFEIGAGATTRTTLIMKLDEFDGEVLINSTKIGQNVTLDPRDSVLRHYAIMRKNGVLGFYINGVLQFTGAANIDIASTVLTLGTAFPFNGPLQGYIQQFRITKLARYEADGFTPDTVFFKS